MKNSQFLPQQSPVQRLEANPQSPGKMPPALQLTADSEQASGALTGQEMNAQLGNGEFGGQGLSEQTLDGQPTTGGSGDGEQKALGAMDKAFSGDKLDVMTEQTMPLQKGQLPGKAAGKFRFGGVIFEVIDVGGDEGARARKILSKTILALRYADTHDYKKNPPKKTIKLYIGDYKSMVAYSQAYWLYPYKKWSKDWSYDKFSGEEIKTTDQYGYTHTRTASTVANSFVSSRYDPNRDSAAQSHHNAVFVDMSQVDKIVLKEKDPLMKQALDLALIIAHEGTHTLTKSGSHGARGHLMDSNGLTLDKLDPDAHVLADEAKVIDPVTGKEKLDMHKYYALAKKLLQEFGKEF